MRYKQENKWEGALWQCLALLYCWVASQSPPGERQVRNPVPGPMSRVASQRASSRAAAHFLGGGASLFCAPHSPAPRAFALGRLFGVPGRGAGVLDLESPQSRSRQLAPSCRPQSRFEGEANVSGHPSGGSPAHCVWSSWKKWKSGLFGNESHSLLTYLHWKGLNGSLQYFFFNWKTAGIWRSEPKDHLYYVILWGKWVLKEKNLNKSNNLLRSRSYQTVDWCARRFQFRERTTDKISR